MVALMKMISYVNDRYHPQDNGKNDCDNGTKKKDTSKDVVEETEKRYNLRKRIRADLQTVEREIEKKDDEIEESPKVDCKSTLIYDVTELLGYIVHPGTVIFGPWCSLESYRNVLEPFKFVSICYLLD